ncbi:hypothetical protein GCM10011348_08510 [Marinobacterium nitratireducens]|uniref:Uncharacterized protein n=2 Tax=Marinobacterium nitratireducens TaxID=518897 RepID=A0A917Z849_9GAMM|nr:hypothetical protein GCM10011348_08510 [Marinobacterium nitratireducens]
MLGIDYGCHQWYQALHAGRDFRIRAFIDDEPWNHRTRIGEAPVQYPGELVALVRKHDACAVLQVEGAKVPPVDSWAREELATLKVPVLVLPARIPPQPSVLLASLIERRA